MVAKNIIPEIITPEGRWPRRLVNFPIVLIAVVQQYIWAFTIIWDRSSLHVTSVNILARLLDWELLAALLWGLPTLAIGGFYMRNRLNNLLALLPQQFILYLSAGGAMEAIIRGQFADGVLRTQAFLLADQCPAFLIAIFHTWAMILILKYSEELSEVIWNSMALILSTAMLIVLVTLGHILWVEHQRRTILWGSPELWIFAATGAFVVIVLWGIMVTQWWHL